VRYIKNAPDLDADADEPLLPDDYHYLIVDGAVGMAYRDSDNYDASQAVDAEFNLGIQEMQDEILNDHYDSGFVMVTYGSSDW
jgi:hypothetical protein